jgi:hypothetical protein
MLPEISLEKVRRDLDYTRAMERARLEKDKRDRTQWERHLKATKFMKKFPSRSCKNLELMEFGCELSELRQNPFFLALKENKVERERLELIKQLQLQMLTNGEPDQERQRLEEELKEKATEAVKTDIFKHTFVDAPDTFEQEAAPTDIMNRPPKDVFTFMNLNFDLPSAYYQSFGDF